MTPYRSVLFVPGHKSDWVPKALAAGPDAIILDLEDSVPDDSKAGARSGLAASLARARRERAGGGVFVRINTWGTPECARDVDAAVIPELDGIMVPKLRSAEDVKRIDAVLSHLEALRGLPSGGTRVIAVLETAEALASCEEIARTTERIVAMIGGGARGGDAARAVGYEWSPEGLETLYLRSRVVLACRAGGTVQPLCSIWQDIGDLDGLRAWALANRRLGYRGEVLIHPSHVGPVNEIFGPSQEDVEFYQAMVAAYEDAARTGDGAIRFRGQHIDSAHVRMARDFLDWAQECAAA